MKASAIEGRPRWRWDDRRFIALFMFLALCLLSLFVIAGLIASHLQQNTLPFQPTGFIVLFFLLVSLVFSTYLLFSPRKLLRRPLPEALLVGLVLGGLLGSLFNLPYFFGLVLIMGMLGPILLLNAAGTSSIPPATWPLQFWLSSGTVLLSLFFYALVAFLSTRRTGLARSGQWASFLTAFIVLLFATLTFVFTALIHSFPAPSQYVLPIVSSFSYLPLSTMFLALSQAVHATLGGFIGSTLGRRRHVQLEDEWRDELVQGEDEEGNLL